jgi:hypothetical protein
VKYLIVCSLLLFSLVPLSCCQKTCRWNKIARFMTEDSDNVTAPYSEQQEPFRFKGGTLQLWYKAQRVTAYAPGVSYFSIDVYEYPDMKLISSPVDERAIGEESTDNMVEVQAEEGTYCLNVSCGVWVLWDVSVEEYVCP